MTKKIKIKYNISKDMEVSFSGLEQLKKYGSLEKFKELSRKYFGKYLLKMDNEMNCGGKAIKVGSLEFEIEKNK